MQALRLFPISPDMALEQSPDLLLTDRAVELWTIR